MAGILRRLRQRFYNLLQLEDFSGKIRKHMFRKIADMNTMKRRKQPLEAALGKRKEWMSNENNESTASSEHRNQHLTLQ